jgi:hypothetical protein
MLGQNHFIGEMFGTDQAFEEATSYTHHTSSVVVGTSSVIASSFIITMIVSGGQHSFGIRSVIAWTSQVRVF